MEPLNFQDIENVVAEKSGLAPEEVYFIEDTRSRSLWYTCLSASLEYPDVPAKRKRTADISKASPTEMIVQVPMLPPIVARLPHLADDLKKVMLDGHKDMMTFMNLCEDHHFMDLNVLDVYARQDCSPTSSGVVLWETLPTHYTRLSRGFDRNEMNKMMVAIAELHTSVLYEHGQALIPHFKRQEPASLINAMKETLKYAIDQDPSIFDSHHCYEFLEHVLTEEEAAMVRNPEERGMPLVVIHRDITPQSVGLLQMSTIRSIFDPCLPAVGSPAEDVAVAFALGMELDKYRNKHLNFLERYHKKLVRNTGRKGIRVPYDFSKFRLEYRRVFPYAACYAAFTLINHAYFLRDASATNKDGEEVNVLLKRAARVLETAHRRFVTRQAYEDKFGPLQAPPPLNQELEDDGNDYASDSSYGYSDGDGDDTYGDNWYAPEQNGFAENGEVEFIEAVDPSGAQEEINDDEQDLNNKELNGNEDVAQEQINGEQDAKDAQENGDDEADPEVICDKAAEDDNEDSDKVVLNDIV